MFYGFPSEWTGAHLIPYVASLHSFLHVILDITAGVRSLCVQMKEAHFLQVEQISLFTDDNYTLKHKEKRKLIDG